MVRHFPRQGFEPPRSQRELTELRVHYFCIFGSNTPQPRLVIVLQSRSEALGDGGRFWSSGDTGENLPGQPCLPAMFFYIIPLPTFKGRLGGRRHGVDGASRHKRRHSLAGKSREAPDAAARPNKAPNRLNRACLPPG